MLMKVRNDCIYLRSESASYSWAPTIKHYNIISNLLDLGRLLTLSFETELGHLKLSNPGIGWADMILLG